MKVFVTSCVNSTADAICPMIDRERNITRRTFLGHVDTNQLQSMERQLGYFAHHKQGLTMSSDWHVRYFKSKFKGMPCVFFRHSAIEYVFI